MTDMELVAKVINVAPELVGKEMEISKYIPIAQLTSKNDAEIFDIDEDTLTALMAAHYMTLNPNVKNKKLGDMEVSYTEGSSTKYLQIYESLLNQNKLIYDGIE